MSNGGAQGYSPSSYPSPRATTSFTLLCNPHHPLLPLTTHMRPMPPYHSFNYLLLSQSRVEDQRVSHPPSSCSQTIDSYSYAMPLAATLLTKIADLQTQQKEPIKNITHTHHDTHTAHRPPYHYAIAASDGTITNIHQHTPHLTHDLGLWPNQSPLRIRLLSSAQEECR